MKTLLVVTLALLLLLGGSARAQKTSDIMRSGQDFLASCQYDNKPEDVCIAYVTGATDVLTLNWSDTGQRVCLPEGTTPRKVLDLVLLYIKEHPEKQEQKTKFLIAQVTIKTYTCEVRP